MRGVFSAVIAEGRPTALDLTPPPAPSFREAEEASKRYVGFGRAVLIEVPENAFLPGARGSG